jgi:hypothetical protein
MRYMVNVLLHIGLCGLSTYTGASHSQEYSVQGTITYSSLASKKPVAPLVNYFHLSFSNCNWTIRVEMPGNTNLQFVACEWDGHDLIYSHGSFKNIANSGFVENVPVPQRTTSAAIEIVWLAYASPCYLASATNGTVLAFLPLRSKLGHISRYAIEADIETSPLAPYFPSRMQFHTSHILALNNSGAVITNSLPMPFTEVGYKSAEYLANRHTKVDGLTFPQAFIYREFRPGRRAIDAPEIESTLTIEGFATNIWTRTHQISTGTSSPQGFYAHDLRVPVPGTLYPVTNGFIPETNSPVVLAAANRASDRIALMAKTSMQRSKIFRNYFWAIAIALAVLPLFGLFWKGRIAPKKQNSHHHIS